MATKKTARKKKKRRGRPPADDPASFAIKAYVTESLYDAVAAKADEEDKTISVIVRESLESSVL